MGFGHFARPRGGLNSDQTLEILGFIKATPWPHQRDPCEKPTKTQTSRETHEGLATRSLGTGKVGGAVAASPQLTLWATSEQKSTKKFPFFGSVGRGILVRHSRRDRYEQPSARERSVLRYQCSE
jgi:hypothetical protein